MVILVSHTLLYMTGFEFFCSNLYFIGENCHKPEPISMKFSIDDLCCIGHFQSVVGQVIVLLIEFVSCTHYTHEPYTFTQTQCQKCGSG